MSYAGNGLSALANLLGYPGCVILLALIGWGIWRQLTRNGPWRCPACKSKQLDWQGTGTRQLEDRTIEYRTYKCLGCSEILVEEKHGPLQRLDGWTPGEPPRKAPGARVIRD